MRKNVRRLVTTVVSVCLTVLCGVIAVPHARAVTGETPCADYVQQASIIDGDTRPDGSPIAPKPGPDGHITPVVLVHGWMGNGRHAGHNPHKGDSQFSLYVDRVADGARGYTLPHGQVNSSFIGMLQQIPGVVVYMFSYEKVANHWVTHPEIGRRLADGIACLSSHYGTKAVVVGHSMGGLATREALSLQDESGKPISDRVAHVITFGTPNVGTDLLQKAYQALDASLWVPGVNIVTGILRLVFKKCSEKLDNTGESCFGPGDPAGALYSEGARSMIPGSAALAALAPLPESVPYTALAGDIKVGGVSMFGYNSKRLVDLGDFAVPQQSALSGTADQTVASCEYGIAAIADKRHHISVKDWVAGSRTTSILTPFDKTRDMATPCFHNNLMSEVGLVAKAADVITQVSAHPVSWSSHGSVAAPGETPPAAPMVSDSVNPTRAASDDEDVPLTAP